MTDLNQKQIERLKENAGRLYRSFAQVRTPEAIAMYGQPANPMAMATEQEIFDFLMMVERVGTEEGWRLDASNYKYGTSEAEVRADAQTRISRDKKRNGVRALKAKYGHEAADQIVFKHSGRHIR